MPKSVLDFDYCGGLDPREFKRTTVQNSLDCRSSARDLDGVASAASRIGADFFDVELVFPINSLNLEFDCYESLGRFWSRYLSGTGVPAWL